MDRHERRAIEPARVLPGLMPQDHDLLMKELTPGW